MKFKARGLVTLVLTVAGAGQAIFVRATGARATDYGDVHLAQAELDAQLAAALKLFDELLLDDQLLAAPADSLNSLCQQCHLSIARLENFATLPQASE